MVFVVIVLEFYVSAFQRFINFISCAQECFVSMYVCAPTCVPGVCGDQKRPSNPPEMELMIIVSCHVGAGN